MGPRTGATTANGAIVKMRYSSTFGRAAPTPTSKKSEPASDTVTKTSPAIPTAWASASRANGVNVVDSRWVFASVVSHRRTAGRRRCRAGSRKVPACALARKRVREEANTIDP